MSMQKEYNTLSIDDIQKICISELKEYEASKVSDYSAFLYYYMKAVAVVDENRFTFMKKDHELYPIIKKLQLDRMTMPDPMYKAKAEELISELMSKHFSGNKLGEFTISNDIDGQQKMFLREGENGENSIMKLDPSMIQDLVANFITMINNNVFNIVVNDSHFNVWYNAMKSLACYGNSVIYLDTGVDYEHFIPYNLELTDVSWIQNEINIIDRVYCRKKYKCYQLQDSFNDDEIEQIRKCYESKNNKLSDNKIINVLHIVCPNRIPSEERPKYSIFGKDKDFLSIILCRDNNSTDVEFPYQIIRVSGYDQMPYIITRINRKSSSANYGYPKVLEAGEAAIANAELQSDITDTATIKMKPPRFENSGIVEGGILNMRRRGINRIDHSALANGVPPTPVSILPTIEGDAIQSAQVAIQMNSLIQDEVLLRTEKNQILRNAGEINNYVSQFLNDKAVIKMSPISASIEAELKKPLLEFIGNYIILHTLNRFLHESKNEVGFLQAQLNNVKKDTLSVQLNDLKSSLNSINKFDEIVHLRFKEKLWYLLTGQSINFITEFNEVTNQNSMYIELKLGYFWDVIFDYDNENINSLNRLNIKKIKNISLTLLPLREEIALMQDVNLKIQSVASLMQIAQIDPESAKVRVNVDKLFSDMRKIPMMKGVIRDDESSMELRQQIAEMQQQQMQQQSNQEE